jgi:hypothetical protein
MLFDHLVGARQDGIQDIEPERLGGLTSHGKCSRRFCGSLPNSDRSHDLRRRRETPMLVH